MVQLHSEVVSGVRAFWVDSGRPTLTASLMFRRGIVDESLNTSGTTHLLEHLALHGRAKGALQVNGSVSLLHTQFDAHGPHEEVADFLRGITTWLAAPELSDVARESSVLRAEAAMRGPSDVLGALVNRYGARGPGLAGYAEPGLSRVHPDAVSRLAGEWFTTGNAVLFLDGPPTADLDLHLPAGSLRTTPVAVSCEETTGLPKMYVSRQGVTVSGVVRRSVPATFLGPALQKVMHDEFRGRDGGAYAPWSSYEAVDADHAVVLAGSDVSQQLLPHVVDRTLEILTRVATSDALTAVVPDLLAQARQAREDPYNAPMLAYRAALEHLRGQEPQSTEDLASEFDAVDADAVRSTVQEMRDSLLLGVDGDAAWADQMPRLEMPTRADGFRGRHFRSRDYPAHRDRLVIADDGIAVGQRSRWRGISRDEVEAVMTYPDGGREVIATDGWSVRVEPTLWRKGWEATRAVDRLTGEDRRLAAPTRDTARVPRPMSMVGQGRSLLVQLAAHPRAFGAAILVLWAAIMSALWIWGKDLPTFPVMVLVTAFAFAALKGLLGKDPAPG